MKNVEFAKLINFFGGYFHQDWDLDAPDTKEIVYLFVKQNPISEVKDTLFELDSLLSMNISDVVLCKLLFETFQCYYVPPDNGSARDWLLSIRKVLADSISLNK